MTTAGVFAVAAIAASAGGLTALRRVLQTLPADFPGAILIVMHLQPGRQSLLAEILARSTPLTVKQAQAGDRIQPGMVLVAPPDYHLIATSEQEVAFTSEPPTHFVRPSADRLFSSIAEVFGSRGIAVVLSGAGLDGADGVLAIKHAGGRVIAQDPSASSAFGMPEAAVKTGAVDEILPLDEVAPALMKLATSFAQHV